jgi:putative ABC transport system permease protein
MNWLRVTMLRLRGVFAGPRRDAELDQELREHLEMLAEENVERGMTQKDALRAARLSLGGSEQIKEAVRERRGLPFVESFAQDACFGLRMLRKNPGFAGIAILTLALGIGANTAIFSVVNGILLEPLPYGNSSRLVAIGTLMHIHGMPVGRQGISLLEIADVQSQTAAFERFAVYQGNMGARIRTDLMPDFVNTSQVSADFFALLGGRPIVGRPILAEDEQDGGKRVAVLSFAMWRQDFGGDANVLNRSFLVDDKPYQIVGVMPRQFTLGLTGSEGMGFWTPLLPDPKSVGRRDARGYLALALLRRGANLKQAEAQLTTLSGRLAATYPKTDKNLDLIATSVQSETVERVRTGLIVLLGAVGFVLLIACVNVSALLVARAWTRQREIAIRKALGATRMRLVRQLLSESAILSLTGGALGLLASVWGVRLLRAIAPPYTPRIEQIRIDANVLWFTLGISILAAVLFGTAPALQASAGRMGGSAQDGLGGSLARGITPRRRVLRGALVATEVSLALILVLGAALMLQSFEKLIHVDTGIRTDHVLVMNASSMDQVCSYKSPAEQCEAAKTEILRRIRSLPGVQMAALSQGYALLGGGYAVSDLYVEGSPDNLMVAQGAKLGPSLLYHAITPDYFEILGIRVLAGRKFNDRDSAASPPVAIVSKTFAEMFLPADPLGKRIAVSKDKQGNAKWIEVVGVVSDDRDTRPQLDPAPLYYLPASQYGYSNVSDYIVRTSQDPVALAPAIEKQIWSVDKDAPIRGIRTMDQSVAISVAEPRFETSLLVSFGVMGLLLSIVGVYGVMSYAVVQRTHEIGVRMALGAKPSSVMLLVVWDGLRLAAIGVASGLAVSWGLARFLRSLLFEIAPTDMPTFAAVAVLLIGVALAACWIPARRATKVDPMVALRYE